MSDRPLSLELGSIVGGKYRLLKCIGEGGHGRVYRAVNTLLGREVAVKVLRPELIQDDTAKKRFFREAKVANKIRHPNVVDVIDVGDSEIGPWMVQELLTGESFAIILQREKQLTIARTIEIMLPVMAAMSAAHTKGIAHRDFKPENIFLARDEPSGLVQPKILDFGLSKPSVTFGSIRDSDQVTGSGVVVGTPAYLAPERIRMESEGDLRGDIWSIGIVLYECVSGELPFAARNVREMFVQIGTSPPTPLEDMLPSVHPEYARIVGKCLRPDAEERYQTASEVEADVIALQQSESFANYVDPPPGTSDRPPTRVSASTSTPPRDAWGEDIVPDSVRPPGRPPRTIAPTPLEIDPAKILAEAEAESHAEARDARQGAQENSQGDAPESSKLTAFVVLGCVALVVIGWFATRTPANNNDTQPQGSEQPGTTDGAARLEFDANSQPEVATPGSVIGDRIAAAPMADAPLITGPDASAIIVQNTLTPAPTLRNTEHRTRVIQRSHDDASMHTVTIREIR